MLKEELNSQLLMQQIKGATEKIMRNYYSIKIMNRYINYSKYNIF